LEICRTYNADPSFDPRVVRDRTPGFDRRGAKADNYRGAWGETRGIREKVKGGNDIANALGKRKAVVVLGRFSTLRFVEGLASFPNSIESEDSKWLASSSE
jgi:hypothetical protein